MGISVEAENKKNIQRNLDKLGNALGKLHESIDLLDKQLNVAMSPNSITCGEKAEPKKECGSEIALIIDDRISTTDAAIYKINQIRERLEL